MERAGLVLGGVWDPSGPVWEASGALLGSFWALLGVSWAPVERLLGTLGRIWALTTRSGVDLEEFREAPGRVLEPPGVWNCQEIVAEVRQTLNAFSIPTRAAEACPRS